MRGWMIEILVLTLAMLETSYSAAKVTGPCSHCHTMHNSQRGESVVATGPIPGLLDDDCKGCHTGFNQTTSTMPYVLSGSTPIYGTTGTEASTNTLAGGNFYWVQSADRAGHNVAGVAGVDPLLGNNPPGGAALGSQLTCSGANGCHGVRTETDPYKAMLGAHHNNSDTTEWREGSTLAESYRFLEGVKGLEDSDYEFRPTADSHNKYYGVDRSLETTNDTGTISNLCAQCHGNFHNGSGEIASGAFGAGAWLRHPTDFDMSRAATSSEYKSYNGGGGSNNPYSVVSPVATADTLPNFNNTVYTLADDAILMCMSCHRAHGTPYDAILRWDYKGWPVGGYNGCAICHTAKD
jgi:hypothetical protein